MAQPRKPKIVPTPPTEANIAETNVILLQVLDKIASLPTWQTRNAAQQPIQVTNAQAVFLAQGCLQLLSAQGFIHIESEPEGEG